MTNNNRNNICMLVNKYNRTAKKIIYIGSDKEFNELKEIYGNKISKDINPDKDIGLVILSSENTDSEGLVKTVNGYKDKDVILRLPKMFEFDEFVRSVNSEYFDIYNSNVRDYDNKHYFVALHTIDKKKH